MKLNALTLNALVLNSCANSGAFIVSEEEYAKREVNLDESESEEDEYEYRSGRDYHQKGGENEDDFGASAVGNAPTDGSAPASTRAQSLVNVVESLGSDGAVAAVDQFAKGDIEEIGGIEDDRTTHSTGVALVDNKHSVGGDGGAGGGALAAKEALGGNSSHSKDDKSEIVSFRHITLITSYFVLL